MSSDGITNRIHVYTCGFPKSGVTWLTRLLGDILDCPTGGSTPAEDAKEIAAEGWDRPGPYVVRKGHYRLLDDVTPSPVPSPHSLHWRSLPKDAPVFFIVRDPRDIVISGAHHWRTSPGEFLRRMVHGEVAHLPPWHVYVTQWLEMTFPCAVICYESLSWYPQETMFAALSDFDLPYTHEWVAAAIKRQSFAERKQQIQTGPADVPLGRDYQLRFMRRGRVGDWRGKLSREMGEIIEREFGEVMRRLGYETDPNWWKLMEV